MCPFPEFLHLIIHQVVLNSCDHYRCSQAVTALLHGQHHFGGDEYVHTFVVKCCRFISSSVSTARSAAPKAELSEHLKLLEEG